MKNVIMVKKLLQSGEPCAKCAQAEQMLRDRGVWDQIDSVVWAEEGKPESPGLQLASRLGIDLAPFFVVREEGKPDRAVTSTLKMIKELGGKRSDTEAPAPTSPSSSAAAAALTAGELATVANELKGKAPSDVLAWGLGRYGAQCGIAFSGAEDVVLIDMAARLGLPFRTFCLDTGRLHEETYRFIDRVRAHYGVDVELLVPDAQPLEAFVRTKGLFSFLEDGHAECCGVRKIAPLKRVLSGLSAWATGQRRDQSPSTRGTVEVVELDTSFKGLEDAPLIKLNPLAHWSSEQVWQYIREERVPYNELHDHGFVSIGCQPCTRPARPGEHERASRWWWEEATQRECGLHVRTT